MGTRWIVVGAGSAGCVAAARLAEREDNEVTLLEHGGALEAGAVPASIAATDFTRALQERGRSHNDLLASRPGERPFPYRRGRGVGGSSAINAMIGLRGNRAQYQAWGWHDVDEAWSRMLLPEEPAAENELGTVDRALLSTARGAERAPLTRRNGQRVTTAEAYVWPALASGRLDVRADAAVGTVLLEGRRAAGVRLTDGTEVTGDRVVLAAGAINSPAVLLWSGVERNGIGANLQDHASVSFALELVEPDARADGVVAGVVDQRGDTQILALNHTAPDPNGRRYGALLVALMRPRGPGGQVALGSSDPVEQPLVRLDALDDPRDLRALRGVVRSALDLLAQPAFREVVEAVYLDDHGTPPSALKNDESIDRWVRSAPGSYLHATSTCAMGSVVDHHGRVIGYDGLYVCDASVFPSIPEVNTHLPTVMLAERLAAGWLRSE